MGRGPLGGALGCLRRCRPIQSRSGGHTGGHTGSPTRSVVPAALSGAWEGLLGLRGQWCCVFQDDGPEKADGDVADTVPESQETVQVIPGSKLLWRVNTRPPNSAQVCAPGPSQAPRHPVTPGAPCPPSPMTPTCQHSAQASTHTSGPGYTANPQCLHRLCLTARVSKLVSRDCFSDLSI